MCHFVLLNSHILAYATCFARKGCGLVRSTRGTSLSEDYLGARDKILNTKVTHGALPGKHCPPKIGLKFRAPLRNFIFHPRNKFQMCVGGVGGSAEADQGHKPPSPPPPPPPGPQAIA